MDAGRKRKESNRLNITFPSPFDKAYKAILEMEKRTGISAAQLGRCAVIHLTKAYQAGEKIDFSGSGI